MLERFLANCLCVISLCTLLWGVSPLFADGSCAVLWCSSGDSTCSGDQDNDGYCLSSPPVTCLGFFNGTCKCTTVTNSNKSFCACRDPQ
jgi:hypothetical protein